MSVPMRVVLDTNVVLSALVFGGGSAARLHLAVAGRAKLLVSGDCDLLALVGALESAHGCPIVPLEVFVRNHLSDAPDR